MRNIYAVIFRENKIIVKSKKREEIIEYKFNDIVTYPNIPYYLNLFESEMDTNGVREVLKKRLKRDIVKNSLLLKPAVFISLPDDVVTNIEKRGINDFVFQVFNSKMPRLLEEGMISAPLEEVNYISIYKSCRMIVITYRKDKLIEAQKFIENKDYTIDDMKGFINNLHDDCLFNKLNVYLNGEGMEKYSVLGEVVEKERLLDNLLKFAKGKPVRKK